MDDKKKLIAETMSQLAEAVEGNDLALTLYSTELLLELTNAEFAMGFLLELSRDSKGSVSGYVMNATKEVIENAEL